MSVQRVKNRREPAGGRHSSLKSPDSRPGHGSPGRPEGQHHDDRLSARFFQDLNLRDPDVHLGIGSGAQVSQVARTMLALEPEFVELLFTTEPSATDNLAKEGVLATRDGAASPDS